MAPLARSSGARRAHRSVLRRIRTVVVCAAFLVPLAPLGAAPAAARPLTDPTSAASSTATADPGDPSAMPPAPAPTSATGPGGSPSPAPSAAPSPAPPGNGGAEPPGTDGGGTGSVLWQPCTGGDVDTEAPAPMTCARVAVPFDHARPGGRTVSLAMLRWPATDPQRRIGALFLNPGGPGGSGVALARNLAPLLDPEVRARYDLIGFDPRGVGASAGLHCGTDDDLLAPVPTGVDPLAAQVAYGTALGTACATEQPGLLATLDTATAARDLEVLRVAVGAPRLHYLGYSYGTALGATYATLFPEHMGRLVLDGPADPTLPYADWVSAQLDSFESVLGHTLAACDATARCPLAGRAAATFAAVLDRATDGGVPVAGQAPLRRTELLDAVVSLLHLGIPYHEVLAGGLDRAAAGDGSTLAEFTRRSSGLSAAAYYGIVCGDEPVRLSEAEVAARIERLSATAPTFAPQLREVLTCNGIDASAPPAPDLAGPHGPEGSGPAAAGRDRGDRDRAVRRAAAVPPALLVATRHDPATPYAGAVALQAALPGSSLLTYDAVGHTIVARGDACVDRAVTTYLLDGTLPARGATCRPVASIGAVLAPDGGGAARVLSVLPGSPAAIAGLAVGDVVSAVEGAPVRRPAQLDEAAGAQQGRVQLTRHRAAGAADAPAEDLVLVAPPAPYWLA